VKTALKISLFLVVSYLGSMIGTHFVNPEWARRFPLSSLVLPEDPNVVSVNVACLKSAMIDDTSEEPEETKVLAQKLVAEALIRNNKRKQSGKNG
jgi:hypothetical protein